MNWNEKPKKPKFSIGSEVLQSLFENGKSPLSDQFMRWKLWAHWWDYVGPTVAQNAEPVGYQRGVLYLWVRNSTWMQQMIFMKDPIQEAINKKMGRKFVKGHPLHSGIRREVPDQGDGDFKALINKIAPESEDLE